MAVILCLETSSVNCSVSLFRDNELLASKEFAKGYSHSENLHVFIEEVFKESHLGYKDLEGIMVGAGPGSFTGLRIGAATAKGLCYALSIPLLSFSSLENMATGVINGLKEVEIPSDLILCPLIDARRMEVYSAQYDNTLNCIDEARAIVLDEHSFKDILKANTVLFFGDGMPKMKALYEGNPNARFMDNILPSSLNMKSKSSSEFELKNYEDVAYYEPFYLKGFHATTPKKLL